MRKYVFVVDGYGIQTWMPMDLAIGDYFHGGTYYGPEFYKKRARLNWDRGGYCMEVDIDSSQEKILVNLLSKKKDWLVGKNYIEDITKRSFETETGFENPFNPIWDFSFDEKWENNRRRWLERAGFEDFDPRAFVHLSLDQQVRQQLNTDAKQLLVDGKERTLLIMDTFHFMPQSYRNSPITIMRGKF